MHIGGVSLSTDVPNNSLASFHSPKFVLFKNEIFSIEMHHVLLFWFNHKFFIPFSCHSHYLPPFKRTVILYPSGSFFCELTSLLLTHSSLSRFHPLLSVDFLGFPFRLLSFLVFFLSPNSVSLSLISFLSFYHSQKFPFSGSVILSQPCFFLPNSRSWSIFLFLFSLLFALLISLAPFVHSLFLSLKIFFFLWEMNFFPHFTRV